MAVKSATKIVNQTRVRCKRLREKMRDKELDSFLATDTQDVSYLSGFTGQDSYLLVSQRSRTLITDSRYLEQAQKQCAGLRVIERKGPLSEAVAVQADKSSLGRIGVEPAAISLEVYRQLGKALGRGRLAVSAGIVRRARMRKDAQEQAAIGRAIKVAEQAFLAAMEWIRPGMSELEIAGRLDLEMKLRGASQAAFETIVACGANSSMPHAHPGSKRVKANQAVLIDWGATVAGYRCDLTRVVFLDSMPQTLRSVYETVRNAGRAGLAIIRPGVWAKEVDAAARKVIEQAGFGKYFGHGLGHGIGKDVHEAPVLGPKSHDVLEEGMVFTVEPGIYIPGRGGIRIENDVLVTKRGCRVLSGLPDDAEWAMRRVKDE